MDSFGKLIALVVIPFLVGFYGVRYYNTTQEPQVPQDPKGVHLESKGVQIETGRIKCINPKEGYCSEYMILKVIKE